MQDDHPLVTIIATCYNHEAYVLDCLEGIRSQTYTNTQLIITDDSSTDQSAKIIAKWIDTNHIKCQFIHHSVNIGLNRTLNEAIHLAKGQYIAHISTDDVWLPDFLSTYIAEFEKRPQECGLVYGNSYVIDETGYRLPYLRKRPDFHPEGYVLFDLIKETFLTSQAVLMKNDYLERVGWYDENLVYEDFDIWTRLAEVCEFAFCPEILSNYRFVKTSLSVSRRIDMAASTIKILERLEKKYPSAKADIEARKVNIAKELYMLDYPNTSRYLYKYFLNHKSTRNLYLTIMSSLGFKFEQSKKLLEIINDIKKGKH
jgi:glycosyltransferase involved in cell wall biosynthesis